MKKEVMTFDEFYQAYRMHDGETPTRKERKFDGYELHFANGDTYVYDEQLKPDRQPHWHGYYFSDDFTRLATWNGKEIVN